MPSDASQGLVFAHSLYLRNRVYPTFQLSPIRGHATGIYIQFDEVCKPMTALQLIKINLRAELRAPTESLPSVLEVLAPYSVSEQRLPATL